MILKNKNVLDKIRKRRLYRWFMKAGYNVRQSGGDFSDYLTSCLMASGYLQDDIQLTNPNKKPGLVNIQAGYVS